VTKGRGAAGVERSEISCVERKLDRYFEAFETGDLSAALRQERVRGHRERLEALRGQEADLGTGRPHRRIRRQTQQPSPASLTKSTTSSPTKAPRKRKSFSACSSKRSACTTAA
jgi:hypothetical protein